MPIKPASNDPTLNPFETRWIRPDSLGYKTADDKSVPELLDLVLASKKPMEVVGTHGIGKTTLAYSLCREAANRGIDAQLIRCGQESFAQVLQSLQQEGKITILDEYERLSRWQRFLIKRGARTIAGQLVVVAHQTQGYTRLAFMKPNLQAIKSVIRHLQLTHNLPEVIQGSDVERLMKEYHNDCREVLFACYDLFHQRKKNR
ncbi:MAG: hypothetical protein CMJ76_06015 [Planctomycetaceae bacterium]|nr:hypothetical protein [Planctomycetaceae bacterium]